MVRLQVVSRLTILTILINLISTPLTGQAKEDALAGFDEWVEAVMDEWKTPGLAIAIIDDGHVVLSKGYGYRNLEEQIPVTSDTLFPIGSNTKSFTALLLGMLVDDGKLTWDTPIKEILTDFQLHDPIATAQMTTRDLLCHRSGLPRHDFCWISGGRTRNEIYQAQRYLKPTEPFRSKFQYSNLMFTTAGILTERITG
ncbi:MAG: serine hydrolase domain-containing protein, partial [Planctomycetota bacterium]